MSPSFDSSSVSSRSSKETSESMWMNTNFCFVSSTSSITETDSISQTKIIENLPN